MELALYCPVYGYYEREEDTIGRRGDFFTNVSVGSLFGELLSCRFAEWLEASPRSKKKAPRHRGDRAGKKEGLQIVEAGAHGGALAMDILRWMRQQRPRLFESLEYWIIEPSVRRQEWQRKFLAEFSERVSWARGLEDLRGVGGSQEVGGVRGLIFCNELLDAMPVRRFGWDAIHRRWFEWGVALEDKHFVWTRMPLEQASEALSTLLSEVSPLSEVLPDGFTVETSATAANWWRRAAESLIDGKLVAIDYGLTSAELFLPERNEGTLRAYRRHRLSRDVLADPGEQDITTHVNFEEIQRTGESVGLSTDGLFYQAQFLTPLVQVMGRDHPAPETRTAPLHQTNPSARPSHFETSTQWTPERVRQFQALTHPEHLGRTFRVLIQSRGSEVNS